MESASAPYTHEFVPEGKTVPAARLNVAADFKTLQFTQIAPEAVYRGILRLHTNVRRVYELQGAHKTLLWHPEDNTATLIDHPEGSSVASEITGTLRLGPTS